MFLKTIFLTFFMAAAFEPIFEKKIDERNQNNTPYQCPISFSKAKVKKGMIINFTPLFDQFSHTFPFLPPPGLCS